MCESGSFPDACVGWLKLFPSVEFFLRHLVNVRKVCKSIMFQLTMFDLVLVCPLQLLCHRHLFDFFSSPGCSKTERKETYG